MFVHIAQPDLQLVRAGGLSGETTSRFSLLPELGRCRSARTGWTWQDQPHPRVLQVDGIEILGAKERSLQSVDRDAGAAKRDSSPSCSASELSLRANRRPLESINSTTASRAELVRSISIQTSVPAVPVKL